MNKDFPGLHRILASKLEEIHDLRGSDFMLTLAARYVGRVPGMGPFAIYHVLTDNTLKSAMESIAHRIARRAR